MQLILQWLKTLEYRKALLSAQVHIAQNTSIRRVFLFLGRRFRTVAAIYSFNWYFRKFVNRRGRKLDFSWGFITGVRHLPISYYASAMRWSSCWYFFFGRHGRLSFMIIKEVMVAVLMRECKTHFLHFLLSLPTRYFDLYLSKMPTPPKYC